MSVFSFISFHDIEKEAEEKRKQEEAEKRKLEMEEKRKKLDEVARKQREREAEIEEKLKRQEGGRDSNQEPAPQKGMVLINSHLSDTKNKAA